MKKIISLIFIALTITAFSQGNIKDSLIHYLISENEFDELLIKDKKVSELYDNIFVSEILNHKELGNQNYGIFKFGVDCDHGLIYLLLKEKSNFMIINIDSVIFNFNKVIDFLDRNSSYISCNDSFAYLKEIVEQYQQNKKKLPWTH
jgi:hypothetical protein